MHLKTYTKLKVLKSDNLKSILGSALIVDRHLQSCTPSDSKFMKAYQSCFSYQQQSMNHTRESGAEIFILKPQQLDTLSANQTVSQELKGIVGNDYCDYFQGSRIGSIPLVKQKRYSILQKQRLSINSQYPRDSEKLAVSTYPKQSKTPFHQKCESAAYSTYKEQFRVQSEINQGKSIGVGCLTVKNNSLTHRQKSSAPTLSDSDGDNQDDPRKKESHYRKFKRSLELQEFGKISFMEIIQKPPARRSSEERLHLAGLLQFTVNFFEQISRSMIEQLSGMLEYRQFEAGEILFRQKDTGDCMYIILEGQVEVYEEVAPSYEVEEWTTKHLAFVGKESVVGDTAIQEKQIGLRSASVRAVCLTRTLLLTKSDFHSVLYNFQVNQNKNQSEFLQRMPVFNLMPKVKLGLVNSFLHKRQLSFGELVFEMGEASNSIYIVRSGQLLVETIFEIDDLHRIPVAQHEWQLQRTTRRYQYRIKEINKGEIFGHEEFLADVPRRCRVRAIAHSVVLACNREQVLSEELAEWRQLLSCDRMGEPVQPLDIHEIVAKVKHDRRLKQQKVDAILDSTGVNPIEVAGVRKTEPEVVGAPTAKALNRMAPWFEQAAHRRTNDQALLSQLSRVKCIKISEATPLAMHVSAESNQDYEILYHNRFRFVAPDSFELKREDDFNPKHSKRRKSPSSTRVDKQSPKSAAGNEKFKRAREFVHRTMMPQNTSEFESAQAGLRYEQARQGKRAKIVRAKEASPLHRDKTTS